MVKHITIFSISLLVLAALALPVNAQNNSPQKKKEDHKNISVFSLVNVQKTERKQEITPAQPSPSSPDQSPMVDRMIENGFGETIITVYFEVTDQYLDFIYLSPGGSRLIKMVDGGDLYAEIPDKTDRILRPPKKPLDNLTGWVFYNPKYGVVGGVK